MKRDLLAAVSGIHLSGLGVDLRKSILGHFPVSRGVVEGRIWAETEQCAGDEFILGFL